MRDRGRDSLRDCARWVDLNLRMRTSNKHTACCCAAVMDEDVAKTLSQPEVGYSRVWEDHRVLSKALAIQTDDTVLCITR